MSKIYKCDRCGSEILKKPKYEDDDIMLGRSKWLPDMKIVRPGFMFTQTKKYECDYGAEIIDLCPECIESLGEWFNGHQREGDG